MSSTPPRVWPVAPGITIELMRVLRCSPSAATEEGSCILDRATPPERDGEHDVVQCVESMISRLELRRRTVEGRLDAPQINERRWEEFRKEADVGDRPRRPSTSPGRHRSGPNASPSIRPHARLYRSVRPLLARTPRPPRPRRVSLRLSVSSMPSPSNSCVINLSPDKAAVSAGGARSPVNPRRDGLPMCMRIAASLAHGDNPGCSGRPARKRLHDKSLDRDDSATARKTPARPPAHRPDLRCPGRRCARRGALLFRRTACSTSRGPSRAATSAPLVFMGGDGPATRTLVGTTTASRRRGCPRACSSHADQTSKSFFGDWRLSTASSASLNTARRAAESCPRFRAGWPPLVGRGGSAPAQSAQLDWRCWLRRRKDPALRHAVTGASMDPPSSPWPRRGCGECHRSHQEADRRRAPHRAFPDKPPSRCARPRPRQLRAPCRCRA